MPGKELKIIPRIAREPEFDMDLEQLREFSDYIHECKRIGDRGTKNARGDFTDQEIRDKAREFLGL
jgi:hypothetical protein